jgi:hypothetical protein
MLNVQRVLVRIRIDRDSLHAKLPAGPQDPDGDLAAIGNQDLFEH